MPIARWACAILFIALLPNSASAAIPTTSPFNLLPRPPEQDKPWTPPKTNLPTKLISATELLFKQGMADPRACEYRQVEVTLSGFPFSSQPIHGWAIPAGADGGRRFAILWNGQVYPVRSVGAMANLKNDVDALIAEDRTARKSVIGPDGKITGDSEPDIALEGEGGSPSVQEPNCLKVCFLLRLGESKLAERYWHQISIPRPDFGDSATQPAETQKAKGVDPYLELEHEWAWMAFDRAVIAHERGGDVVSLEFARMLAAALPQIEITAAARHFPRPAQYDRRTRTEIPDSPYLLFLEHLSDLVADEERRVKEGHVDRVLDHPDQYKDKTKRIAGLIRDLENDSAKQFSEPGYPPVGDDPVAVALKKEGTDAVEPILDCLANDNRLTRAVSGRWFAEDRNFVPVSEAAYVVLCRILEVEHFGPASQYGWDPYDRDAIVGEIREYWKKNKGLSPEERWYRTLVDDSAGPDRWLESIRQIVQPADATVYSGWLHIPPRIPDEAAAMRGESLRARTTPSVTDLIAKRVPEVAATDANSGMSIFAADNATTAALALARWDRKSAIPIIQAQLDEVAQVGARWAGQTSQDDLLAKDTASFYAGLENLGDHGVCRQYAAWIRRLPVPDMPMHDLIFLPMWQEPTDPDIAAAAEWLFNDPRSPWYALHKTRDTTDECSRLAKSPLMGMPAFRKNLLRNLQDHTFTSETSDFGITVPPNDPLAPRPGEKRSLRVCDWYGDILSDVDGAPDFELYWPHENRDAAIKQDIEYLQAWGKQFAWTPMQQAMFDYSEPRARLTFVQRDRPATDAEVKTHTAIFSLGGGNVRVVPIDPFPRAAKWVTLKNFVEYGMAARTGINDPAKFVSWFDQDGLVWQAEEKWEGGKWKRYYGFAGHHIVAMVPAEEIEFATPEAPATRP